MEQDFYLDRVDFVAQGGDWIISCFRFPTALLMELCAELQLHLECVLLQTHSTGTVTCTQCHVDWDIQSKCAWIQVDAISYFKKFPGIVQCSTDTELMVP